MILNKSITVVIPCRNEAEALPKLIAKIPKYVDEVVVVDNASSDNSVGVAKKCGVMVVSEHRKDKKGIGYGYAHRKGMRVASGDYVVTMDGDGTYPINSVKPVIEQMEKQKLDFVTCNRFPLKHKKAVSKIRRFGVWVLNTEVALLYGYPMKDILSGMWVMNRKTAKRLKLKEGGWDLSPEVKLTALMTPGIRVGQYHIRHHYRSGGKSKQKLWETGVGHMLYILRRRLVEDNPAISLWREVRYQAKGLNWEKVSHSFGW